jgi:hypothetical protein
MNKCESKSINQLPQEMFFNILSYLSPKDFKSSSLVCKKWNKYSNNPVVYNRAMYERFAVGDKKWKQWFRKGIVTEDETANDFNTLPKDIFKILNGPCPIFSGKKVRDTHLLFKMPTIINGEPVTITNIGKLLKKSFPKTENGYRYILSDIVTALGEERVQKAEWILVTKEVLPDSRNKTYSKQKTLVSNLTNTGQVEYQIPKTIELIVGLFAEYLRSGKRLLNSDTQFTYGRCQDQVQGFQVVVGGFTSAGLGVLNFDYDYDSIGVVALRKF